MNLSRRLRVGHFTRVNKIIQQNCYCVRYATLKRGCYLLYFTARRKASCFYVSNLFFHRNKAWDCVINNDLELLHVPNRKNFSCTLRQFRLLVFVSVGGIQTALRAFTTVKKAFPAFRVKLGLGVIEGREGESLNHSVEWRRVEKLWIPRTQTNMRGFSHRKASTNIMLCARKKNEAEDKQYRTLW